MFYQTRNSFLNDSETSSYRMECRYLHLSCIVPSAKIAIPAGVISICPDTPAAANIQNPPSARWNPPYTLAKSPISRPISKARVLLDKSRMKSMKDIERSCSVTFFMKFTGRLNIAVSFSYVAATAP